MQFTVSLSSPPVYSLSDIDIEKGIVRDDVHNEDDDTEQSPLLDQSDLLNDTPPVTNASRSILPPAAVESKAVEVSSTIPTTSTITGENNDNDNENHNENHNEQPEEEAEEPQPTETNALSERENEILKGFINTFYGGRVLLHLLLFLYALGIFLFHCLHHPTRQQPSSSSSSFTGINDHLPTTTRTEPSSFWTNFHSTIPGAILLCYMVQTFELVQVYLFQDDLHGSGSQISWFVGTVLVVFNIPAYQVLYAASDS